MNNDTTPKPLAPVETQPKPEAGLPLGAAHVSADWEYICVEVTRTESTDLYLKVPKVWRPARRDYKLMGRAAKETTRDGDWDNYGWENEVDVQGHKPVDAKEAEQYLTFDARPYLPNAELSDSHPK
jgi:hypothetical protein